MAKLQSSGILEIGRARLEYRMIGPPPKEAPTLVLLHEGLGCVGLWNSFPDRLAAATGAGVFVYSREGYGASSPAALPRPLTYMHDEALQVLPRVLDAIGFRRGLLVGHSDGASIAAIYAGSVQDHRIRGLSLIAPHFFVEGVTAASIEAAREAYEGGGLRGRLARWHKDVDLAFRGWNDAWLHPGFRAWDISEALAYIRVPIQIIQGSEDPYGSRRQIEVAEAECYCPVEVSLLPAVGHAPHREASDETVATMVAFADRLLKTHGEGVLSRAA
ncbi:alpha/beta fold hydrolase [Chelatococcus reniformis]|uniref:alpha/beta fold hydrolase n=1 Tax=Chelatococcus reniformis TaxID=1494448 RepID=UPI001FCE6BC4|nr:alpha/beta hydrolase [Chelatococcus reniformis]